MYLALVLVASVLVLGAGLVFGRWSLVAPLLFGLASASAFGAIDAMFFLTAEKELDERFADWGIPSELIPLVVGAISASISLFISSWMRHYLGRRFNVMESPYLDVLGIMAGTFVICAGYILYLRYRARSGVKLTQNQTMAIGVPAEAKAQRTS